MDFLRHPLACLMIVMPLVSNATTSPGKVDFTLVELVFMEICKLEIQQPQIVMRQAIMETGWMRARFLMERQNLFGFRTSQYLRFDHWKDSVAYYKAWQNRNYSGGDQEEYGAFLKRIRYGTASYVRNLQKIKWERSCPEKQPSSLSSNDDVSTPITPVTTGENPAQSQ